jgi:hypothetical protein
MCGVVNNPEAHHIRVCHTIGGNGEIVKGRADAFFRGNVEIVINIPRKIGGIPWKDTILCQGIFQRSFFAVHVNHLPYSLCGMKENILSGNRKNDREEIKNSCKLRFFSSLCVIMAVR